MFRKYFQTADDEEDDPGLADSVPDPSVDPDELWGKVRMQLHGQSSTACNRIHG